MVSLVLIQPLTFSKSFIFLTFMYYEKSFAEEAKIQKQEGRGLSKCSLEFGDLS